MSHCGNHGGESKHLFSHIKSTFQSIHQQFEQQVERTPQAIAIRWRDESFTYEALNRRANQIARYLCKQRPQSGEFLVGLCVERSFDLIAAVFGIFKAGGGYLPLDPHYPHDRLALMIEDAKPSVILTQSTVQAILPETTAAVVCLDESLHIPSQQVTNLGCEAEADALAYIIYTSGSTGRPKGVVIEQGALSSFVVSATKAYLIQASDRVLQFASISFDVAAEEIYPCLLAGGTLVLQTPEMMSSVSTFLTLCGMHGVTVLDLPTAFWHVMVAELCADSQLSIPSSIRTIIFGGEAVNPERVCQWQRRFSHHKPSIQLINAYGPTETTVDAIVYAIPQSEQESDAVAYTSIPIGKPLPNVTALVLNEQLQEVPDGEEGELYIGGSHLARGYLHRPELTAERFIPNPLGQGRLYKTGDWCRKKSDDNIEYLGRIDSQVKLRGFRVELGEIESILLEQPGVQETAVVVNCDASAQQRLVAYVVISAAESFDSLRLHLALQRKLPSYMLPAAFVELDTLPLTPSDKVDRKALAAMTVSFQAHKIEEQAQGSSPKTDVEVTLAQLWQESLQSVLGERCLEVNDNFFELGGTSLMAVQLFSRIEKTFDQKIQLSTLFEAPTIHQLAKCLERSKKATQSNHVPRSIIPLKTEGCRPPFFFLNSGVYAHQFVPLLSKEQPLYNLNLFNAAQDLINPSEKLSIAKIAKAFIADMQSVQPQGPYYIGGFCADTKVVAEMAYQLQRQGEVVALLIMIDPAWDEPNEDKKIQFHLKRLLHFGPQYLIEKIKDIWANLFESSEEEVKLQLGFSSHNQDSTRRLILDSQAKVSQAEVSDVLQEVSLLHQYEDLCLSFRPHPYAGKVAVIFSKEAAQDPRDLLEDRLTSGFQEYILPGLHLTIFEDVKYRRQLVHYIEQAIAEASE